MKTLTIAALVIAASFIPSAVSAQGVPPSDKCQSIPEAKEEMKTRGAELVFSGVDSDGDLILIYRSKNGAWAAFYHQAGIDKPMCRFLEGGSGVHYLNNFAV